MESHYPNRISQILIVQTNLDNLSEKSRNRLRRIKKLNIFDSTFRTNILKFIDPENLMSEYGGLKTYFFKGADYGQLPNN